MMIDLPAIRTQFGALRENYENAQPFAHVALTDVFDRATLRTINAEFPTTEHMGGELYRRNSGWEVHGIRLGKIWANHPGLRIRVQQRTFSQGSGRTHRDTGPNCRSVSLRRWPAPKWSRSEIESSL
jgi:hypothetical protein